MDRPVVDLRLERAEHVRDLWLEGFPNGGIFLPGSLSLASATPVVVRIHVDEPRSVTLLLGTVQWRRYPRTPGRSEPPVSLRPGLGVAFDPGMEARLDFLTRLSRGEASERRAADRYPSTLTGELVLEQGARVLDVRIRDVGSHGASIRWTSRDDVVPGSPARLWVAVAVSGESAFSPLVGQVVWAAHLEDGAAAGVSLALGSREERLHWAKVFNHARHALESKLEPEPGHQAR